MTAGALWGPMASASLVDPGELSARGRILRQRREVLPVAVVHFREQQMLALGRIIDDAAARAGLVDRPLDRRRSEILELEIGEGLSQLALGRARRCGERISDSLGRRRALDGKDQGQGEG